MTQDNLNKYLRNLKTGRSIERERCIELEGEKGHLLYVYQSVVLVHAAKEARLPAQGVTHFTRHSTVVVVGWWWL